MPKNLLHIYIKGSDRGYDIVKFLNSRNNNTFYLVSLLVFAILTLGLCRLSSSSSSGNGYIRMTDSASDAVVGGVHDSKGNQNDLEIESLGRFAVEEHNKKENALLEFQGIVNSKEQVVAGTMYYLTLEANDGGVKKTYEAKVWVKPWMNFKQLEEFKEVA